MRDRADVVLADLTRRVGMLEIELHGSGDSVSRLLQELKYDAEQNKLSREVINDLENRLLLLEERTRPCPETQKLRELATLLVKLPGGLWSPFYALIALNVITALVVDLMGAARVIRQVLGV